jgi:hypothetical protein
MFAIAGAITERGRAVDRLSDHSGAVQSAEADPLTVGDRAGQPGGVGVGIWAPE